MDDPNQRQKPTCGRQSERHDVQFHLLYDDGEAFDIASVENMSMGGVFVRTANPLPEGTEVYLSPVGDGDGFGFEVKARVVWTSQARGRRPGMGLEFIDPGHDIVASLDRLRVRAAIGTRSARAQI